MPKKISDRQLLARHFGDQQPLRIFVLTLSDRASTGEYEDKSGPRLTAHIESFFENSGIELALASKILSDDPDSLRQTLETARAGGVHAVFATGGTGIGPRDNTPDVILELADKTIPGIMEAVRMKYAVDKPCALISRSVAATMASTVVYALPGSSKGVDEYMEEILKSFEHVLCVLNGLEVH